MKMEALLSRVSRRKAIRSRPRTRGSAGTRAYAQARVSLQARDSDVFADLAFTGLDLVPPGVVLVSEWRPQGDGPRPSPSEVNIYGGVARKR
jgi:hypothetical protein